MDKYYYSKEFQLEVLGVMFSEQILSNYRDCFDPDYFSEPGYGDVAAAILSTFESTGLPPSRTFLREEVKASNLKDIVALIPAVRNKEAVIERIIAFARKQAIKLAIREGTKDLISEDYESIADRIVAATEVGRGHADLGRLHGEFADGPQTTDGGTPVPTGIARLDEDLRGGFRQKRLYTVTGLSGSGKSQLLVNFAWSALANRVNTLYVTCELTEWEVAQRFEQRISQIDDTNYASDYDIVKQRVEEFYKKSGKLIIKEYAPGEVTCRDIEILMDRIEKKLHLPVGILFTDYGDEMSSTIKFQENKKRLEQGQIWRDHKALAKHKSVPVITACQSNAGGYDAEILGMQNAAESQDKPRVSDVWITINQTPDEALQHQMRLYIDKNRTGPKGGTAIVRADHARCTIRDKT